MRRALVIIVILLIAGTSSAQRVLYEVLFDSTFDDACITSASECSISRIFDALNKEEATEETLNLSEFYQLAAHYNLTAVGSGRIFNGSDGDASLSLDREEFSTKAYDGLENYKRIVTKTQEILYGLQPALFSLVEQIQALQQKHLKQWSLVIASSLAAIWILLSSLKIGRLVERSIASALLWVFILVIPLQAAAMVAKTVGELCAVLFLEREFGIFFFASHVSLFVLYLAAVGCIYRRFPQMLSMPKLLSTLLHSLIFCAASALLNLGFLSLLTHHASSRLIHLAIIISLLPMSWFYLSSMGGASTGKAT